MKYPFLVTILALFLLWIIPSSFGPPNCNLFDGDCKEACHECEKAIMHGQGTRKLQVHFDKAIDLCPTFAYAYYEKAVPYAKRGLMREWKVMIDKAVESEPADFLSRRGWYHYFFMHNYEDAIEDIERLEKLLPDIGFTGDGVYHLKIMKAICLKELGKLEIGIQLVKDQISVKDYSLGMYDYLTLGCMQLDNDEYGSAIENLEKQKLENDVSEIYYYLAKAYLEKGNLAMAKKNIEIALAYYDDEQKMKNSYRQLAYEVYRLDITDLQKRIAL